MFRYIRYLVCLKKSVNSNVVSFNLNLFPTKVDTKSIIRDYSLTKAILALGPKKKGREGIRTVRDIEITGALCKVHSPSSRKVVAPPS